MTIRKGEPWGEAGGLSDRPAGRVDRSRRSRLGDLAPHARISRFAISASPAATWRARAEVQPGPHPTSAKVTVDAMRVTLDDGEPTWGVAHVVARRQWLRDELVMVMNAQFLGAYDVAPRSHPNDGKVDVVRVDRGDGLARAAAGPAAGAHRHAPSASAPVDAVRSPRSISTSTRRWSSGSTACVAEPRAGCGSTSSPTRSPPTSEQPGVSVGARPEYGRTPCRHGSSTNRPAPTDGGRSTCRSWPQTTWRSASSPAR